MQTILMLLVIFLAMIVILTIPSYSMPSRKERKTKESSLKHATDHAKAYAHMYDSIYYDNRMHAFEKEVLSEAVSVDDHVLDARSRTGRVAGSLNAEVVGLDESKEMVELSKERYPDKEFVVGNALDRATFPAELFTRVLCLGNGLYYFSEKLAFFRNAYYWLDQHGKLVLETNEAMATLTPPLSKIHLKESGGFVGNVYRQQFTDSNGDKVHTHHTLYPESVEQICALAKSAGFIEEKVWTHERTSVRMFSKRSF
jgi:SAM-dependent methyltransferase